MLLLRRLLQIRDGVLCRLLLLQGFIDCLLRLRRGLGLDLTACSRKLVRECCGTRLGLCECAVLLLGGRRHRLRGPDFLHQGGGPLLLLLLGLSQFRDGALRRLLLLQGFIDHLLRLRGVGLYFAACSSKLARECCGTRLSLFECAALFLGTCRQLLACRADLLREGRGLLLLLLQRLLQFGGRSFGLALELYSLFFLSARYRRCGLDLPPHQR